ncbi:MAG TPA: hypothetical protein VH230_01060 [Stellaceae bacterium]|nr:hypothetical protein [Stellaceae bacterium]
MRELNESIFAENVSSVGFVGLLIEQYGQHGELAGPEPPKQFRSRWLARRLLPLAIFC